MDLQNYLGELSAYNSALQQKQAVDQNKSLEYENLKNGLIEGVGLPASFGIGSKALSSESVKSGLKQLLKTGNDDIDNATSDLIEGGNPIDVASKLVSQKITQPLQDAFSSLKDKVTNALSETPEEASLDPLSRVQGFVNRIQNAGNEALDDASQTFYTLKRNLLGDPVNPDDGGDVELQNFAEGTEPIATDGAPSTGLLGQIMGRFNSARQTAEDFNVDNVTDQITSRVSQLRQQLPTMGEDSGEGFDASGLLDQAKSAIQGRAEDLISGIRQNVENRVNDFTDNIYDNVMNKVNQLNPMQQSDMADLLPEGAGSRVDLNPSQGYSLASNEPVTVENGVNLTAEAQDIPGAVANGISDAVDGATGAVEGMASTASGLLSGATDTALGTTEAIADADPVTAVLVGIPVAIGGLIASFAELFKKHHSDSDEASTLSLPSFQSGI